MENCFVVSMMWVITYPNCLLNWWGDQILIQATFSGEFGQSAYVTRKYFCYYSSPTILKTCFVKFEYTVSQLNGLDIFLLLLKKLYSIVHASNPIMIPFTLFPLPPCSLQLTHVFKKYLSHQKLRPLYKYEKWHGCSKLNLGTFVAIGTMW